MIEYANTASNSEYKTPSFLSRNDCISTDNLNKCFLNNFDYELNFNYANNVNDYAAHSNLIITKSINNSIGTLSESAIKKNINNNNIDYSIEEIMLNLNKKQNDDEEETSRTNFKRSVQENELMNKTKQEASVLKRTYSFDSIRKLFTDREYLLSYNSVILFCCILLNHLLSIYLTTIKSGKFLFFLFLYWLD